MTDDLTNIGRYVGTLARRERALLVARIATSLAVLGATVWLLAIAAAALRWDRPLATGLVVATAGVGAWFLGAAPALAGWSLAGNLVRQARLVEHRLPDLHGRLLITVERLAGPAPGESGAIVEMAARRARSQLGRAPPQQIHPAAPLRGQVAVAVLAWMLVAACLLISPLGLFGTASWWLSGTVPHDAFDAAQLATQGDTARVGDLVLRYVYPRYTGLEPHVVTNGTGDAHGPPGTIVEVTARAAEVVDAAALQVGQPSGDEPPLEAAVGEDQRGLSGQFTIGDADGVWRILTWRGGAMLASREFKIVPEPDLAPEVQVDAAAAVLEVAADEPIGLSWRARDDFGLSKVVLELDGNEGDGPLAAPLERRAELQGALSPTPTELGLSAGDHVKLTIAAWDNDEVSGHKVGRSREIEVVVLGANGLDARAEDRHRELRKLLLHTLADFLEEPWPPGRTGGSVAAWGELVSKRYHDVDSWFDVTWGDRKPRSTRDRVELKVFEDVTDARTRLVRFTQVSFLPGSDTPLKEADAVTALELRDHAVTALENGILLLDRMIQAEVMEGVQERAEQLGEVARDVKSSLEQDMSAQEMLTRLDHLERSLKELLSETARLPDGGLQEFTNQRGQELQALSEQIREALARGDIDEARELMKRLADEVEQLSDGILDQLDDAGQKESEFAQQAKDVVAEMKKLEADQRALQQELKQQREAQDQQSAAQAEAAWDALEKLASEHIDRANAYTHGLEDAGRAFNEQERARDGVDRSTHLGDAIKAHDLRSAQRAVDDAIESWMRAEWMRQIEESSRGALKGPGARQSDALQQDLARIKAALDQLSRSNEGQSPESAAQAQAQESRQRQMSERLDQLKQDAKGLSEQMTITPEGVEENLGEAEQSMQSAGDDLKDGNPMPAEGSQGTAADRIREAREALQQALQSQSQSGKRQKPGEGEGSQGGKKPGEEGEDDQDGDGKNPSGVHLEIPDAESFRTPEEYRQELLDGMQGDVPDEYEALKKRYYEELVKQ